MRHVLPRAIAKKVLQLTEPWREAAAVVFDRPSAVQVMIERFHADDSLRAGYYSRNKDFIAFAAPLETCLTEDPIQVMFSGNIAPLRDLECALRAAPFAKDFALAVTIYGRKDFAMIDVIKPQCSKGSSLAEWAAVRGIAREEILAIGDNHNDLEMLTAGIPVVMANSVDELKCFGWQTAATMTTAWPPPSNSSRSRPPHHARKPHIPFSGAGLIPRAHPAREYVVHEVASASVSPAIKSSAINIVCR